ncbi:MAG: methyl-accepting chemotaxis protein [Elusimicrobia bacterium]|nr:methyl-accepting chemotaxis protein [Elusimicrobiota bacterium]
MNNEFSADKDRREKHIKIVPGKMRALQFKIFRLTIVTVVITIFFSIIGYYSAMHIVLNAVDLGRFAERQLAEVNYWIGFLFMGVTLVSVVIGGILSFHLSHRIAGPIYRIETLLNEMLETNAYTPIKTRSRDELKSLIEILNKFIQKTTQK